MVIAVVLENTPVCENFVRRSPCSLQNVLFNLLVKQQMNDINDDLFPENKENRSLERTVAPV